jgi:hypothetical protein
MEGRTVKHLAFNIKFTLAWYIFWDRKTILRLGFYPHRILAEKVKGQL